MVGTTAVTIRAWLLLLKNPQLLPEQYELDILDLRTATTHPDAVEQQRERVGEQQAKHPVGVTGIIPGGEMSSENRPGVEREKALESFGRIFRTVCASWYASMPATPIPAGKPEAERQQP